MREYAVGDLVRSRTGRDSGALLFVVGHDGEHLLLADGRLRKIDRPKRKKPKHVAFAGSPEGRVPEKMRNGERVTNSELRKTVSALCGTLPEQAASEREAVNARGAANHG